MVPDRVGVQDALVLHGLALGDGLLDPRFEAGQALVAPWQCASLLAYAVIVWVATVAFVLGYEQPRLRPARPEQHSSRVAWKSARSGERANYRERNVRGSASASTGLGPIGRHGQTLGPSTVVRRAPTYALFAGVCSQAVWVEVIATEPSTRHEAVHELRGPLAVWHRTDRCGQLHGQITVK